MRPLSLENRNVVHAIIFIEHRNHQEGLSTHNLLAPCPVFHSGAGFETVHWLQVTTSCWSCWSEYHTVGSTGLDRERRIKSTYRVNQRYGSGCTEPILASPEIQFLSKGSNTLSFDFMKYPRVIPIVCLFCLS